MMGASSTPWSVDADRDGQLVKLTVHLSIENPPMRIFRPFLDLELDYAHATMLFAQLHRALTELRAIHDTAIAQAGDKVVQICTDKAEGNGL